MTTINFEPSGYVEPQSGLPFEYERDYGTARRNAEVPDIFDHPVVFCPSRIDSPLGSEQLSDFVIFETGPTGDDFPHS